MILSFVRIPSTYIKCMDTGKVFASQKDANVSVYKNNGIYLESNNQLVNMLL